MPMLPNPAKTAIRDRSVYTVTIWDDFAGIRTIAHQFTTIANRAEVRELVQAWLKPLQTGQGLTDAQMRKYYPWTCETKIKRTN